LTSNYKGTLIASACKGSQLEQSAIRLRNCTASWKEVERLVVHTLTVVQLEFSHNDKYLLSASRDRHFCVFEILEEGEKVSVHIISKVKAHSRIVWGCGWSYDDQFIATGSRDKIIKIWKKSPPSSTEDKKKAAHVEHFSFPTFAESITAIAWIPVLPNIFQKLYQYVLGVGLENGTISLWFANAELSCWLPLIQIQAIHSHIDAVKRLRWRTPICTNNAPPELEIQLASCSTDHSLRIFSFYFPSGK